MKLNCIAQLRWANETMDQMWSTNETIDQFRLADETIVLIFSCQSWSTFGTLWWANGNETIDQLRYWPFVLTKWNCWPVNGTLSWNIFCRCGLRTKLYRSGMARKWNYLYMDKKYNLQPLDQFCVLKKILVSERSHWAVTEQHIELLTFSHVEMKLLASCDYQANLFTSCCLAMNLST